MGARARASRCNLQARQVRPMFHTDDIALEMARTMRELEGAVRAKLAARQLGELFYDLPQPKDHRDDNRQR